MNKETTRCVGGVDAEECYIAVIDLRGLHNEVVSFFLSSGGKIVLGFVLPEEYNLRTFGFMTAVDACYVSGGKLVVKHPCPVFVRLANNEVYCIMVPCF